MKPLLRAVLAMMCLNSFNASADLITINAPDEGKLGNLDHYKAYMWRINLAGRPIPSGEEITGITLKLNDIYNWRVEPNILHISMLDQRTPFSTGDLVVEAHDFQYSTNFFSMARNTVAGRTGYTATTPVGVWQDADGGATKNDLAFTVDVARFTEYAADNDWISFGFDPDCHFFNSGVSLEIATRTQSVPEPSIWKLFALSLLWIPFNRWERKQDPSNSGKNDDTER